MMGPASKNRKGLNCLPPSKCAKREGSIGGLSLASNEVLAALNDAGLQREKRFLSSCATKRVENRLSGLGSNGRSNEKKLESRSAPFSPLAKVRNFWL
jgi:hypothetical protein